MLKISYKMCQSAVCQESTFSKSISLSSWIVMKTVDIYADVNNTILAFVP